MGSTYTREERIEFEHYKRLIDKAVEERERWTQYKQIKKNFNQNLKDKKK